jgi:hypothetical protein
MTIDEIVAKADFPEASVELLQRVLGIQGSELTILPDGRIWFIGLPVPLRYGFDSLTSALEFAFSMFRDGATIEELRRVLCLSTDNGVPITRMAISRELTGNSKMFSTIQRGKWNLASPEVTEKPGPGPGNMGWDIGGGFVDDEGTEFNAEVFFGGAFAFAEE